MFNLINKRNGKHYYKQKTQPHLTARRCLSHFESVTNKVYGWRERDEIIIFLSCSFTRRCNVRAIFSRIVSSYFGSVYIVTGQIYTVVLSISICTTFAHRIDISKFHFVFFYKTTREWDEMKFLSLFNFKCRMGKLEQQSL